MTWTELEHTADMGLRIEAPDSGSLVEECAKALYAYIPPGSGDEAESETVKWTAELDGIDMEELFIRWLNELIYLWATQPSLLIPTCVPLAPVLPKRTGHGRLGPGTGGTCPFKAATYGGARLETGPPAVLTVYFDV